MINKLINSKTQLPFTPIKHSHSKSKITHPSQQSLSNSVKLPSSTSVNQFLDKNNKNIDPQLNKIKKQILKGQNKVNKEKQNNSIESSSSTILLNTSQSFTSFTKKQPPQTLNPQKLQNVSCLYSDYLYSNPNHNLFDSIKSDKYRHIIENERIQKNDLIKQLEQKTSQLEQSQKQKQTIKFAYHTLQVKIKEQEKMIKRIRFGERRQNVSINIKNGNLFGNNLFNIQQQVAGDMMDRRKLVTQQGLVMGKQGIEQLSIMRQYQSAPGLVIGGKNIWSQEDGQQEQKLLDQCVQMQQQINKMSQVINQLEKKNSQLQATNKQLENELNKIKESHARCEKQLNQEKINTTQLHSQLTSLTLQLNQTNTHLAQTTQQLHHLHTAALQKQQLISSLSQSNFLYLQKQQRQQQQLQLLKQFTHKLQLNDEKISQFVKEMFNNQLQQPTSGDRMFKQDLSYVLYLVKKKQNVYNELIKEYQDKSRETDTRCYLIEKKLMLTEQMLGKVQTWIQQLIMLTQNETNNIPNHNRSPLHKAEKRIKSIPVENLSKYIQTLKSIIDTYQLDKRII